MAISTTSLTNALGAFYRANRNVLVRDLYLDLVSDDWVVYDGVKDELPLPKLSIAELVKPGNNSTFSPTSNAIVLGARVLKTRNWKVDLQIDPAALEKTWLGFTQAKGARQMNIPLEQFIIEDLIKRIKKDIRVKALYKGVYNSGGTTTADILNGLLKLVTDELTAGNLTAIVTGAITSANVVDKLLLVHDGLGQEYKEVETVMPVNSQIFDWYTRKFSPILNSNLIGAGGMPSRENLINEMRLEGTNCVIKREVGLGTSQRLIVSIPQNRVIGVDSMDDYTNFEFQRFERTIKVLVDGKLGVQLAQTDNGAIAVNDQV
jgi:hypothetical protein